MKGSRKFITVGTAASFVVVGTTGVIFQFFFKNHTLEEIHGWVGIWLVGFAIFHLIQNLTPLKKHLAQWPVYVVLVPIVMMIAAFTFGPEGNEGGKPGGGFNPRELPRKLAGATVADLAKVFNKDQAAVLAAIATDGLKAGSADETVQQIAEKNNASAEKVLGYFMK